MTKLALFMQLKAKAGKEEEVVAFLKDAAALLEQEPLTSPGLQCGSTSRPSASSMLSRATKVARPPVGPGAGICSPTP
ncbi:hypothetical protein RlegWSM1455_26850 (plasmid) [Rhizobium laguerreae]|uniref:hypothetical protein n=1 Tax=Rhizobium laguerreae TaxID=1076926 RepID=UPI001E3E7CAD|nr:hypothetical protein [Rhizobium laguerreae]UFW67007.1 hypothetical protein RlegWSM1455_26850 [Rhizobium laguerreae]